MNIDSKVKKEKNTSFMSNVLMLMVAQVVIKILGFVYRIVIINVEGFGDVGNGYYSVGYQVYSLLLTLSAVGIPTIISKLVSERIAVGDNKGAHRIFKTALIIFTTIGIFFSLILFLGAEIIATKIYNVPNVKYTLMVLAPAIAMVTASAVLRGYFSGLGSMKSTSVAQIIEQFFNCVLTITFVYALIGKDSAIMAAGGNLSTTLSIVISLGYLIFFYNKRKMSIAKDCNEQTVETEDKTTKQIIKTIFAVSIPMTIGSLVSVINSTIDTITISNCIQQAYQGIIIGKEALESKAMELTGMVSKIETIIHLPLAVTATFCTALVPSISASLAKKDMETAKKRLSFSFFATILITMPCAVGLSVIAKPILEMIYPAASDGALILALTTITMLFVSLNYVVNGGLYGLGKIHVPAVALAIGGVIKLILNIVLISNPKINIYGATISSIICQGLAFFICLYSLEKHLKLDIKFVKHIFKPIFVSGIMGLVVFLTYNYLIRVIGNSISTIIAITVGAIVYCILIIITRTLTKEEIYMIPYGTKIYSVLTKLKLYQ